MLDADPNVQLDTIALEMSCKYYFLSMSRDSMYDELTRTLRSKNDVNHILMLVACMQNPHKPCFPAYQKYANALREAIRQTNTEPDESGE
jgi:hypothetical protein